MKRRSTIKGCRALYCRSRILPRGRQRYARFSAIGSCISGSLPRCATLPRSSCRLCGRVSWRNFCWRSRQAGPSYAPRTASSVFRQKSAHCCCRGCGPATPNSQTRMRILLAQNSRYYPAHGGGDKSNRLLMEGLAARGHTCLVVARISQFGPREHDVFLNEIEARGVPVQASNGVVVFNRAGVEVHTVTHHPSLRVYFSEQIARFHPDVVLASTDDPAQLLLEPALRMETAR